MAVELEGGVVSEWWSWFSAQGAARDWLEEKSIAAKVDIAPDPEWKQPGWRRA